MAAAAKVSLDYFGNSGSGAFTNNVNLGYSVDAFVDKDETVGWRNDFDVGYLDSSIKAQLNSAMSEFELSTKSYDVSYRTEIYERFIFTLRGHSDDFNAGQASAVGYSYGAGFRISGLRVLVTAEKNETKQISQVIVLTKDVTSQMKFNSKSTSVEIGYQWTDWLYTKLSGTNYEYDENLDNYAALFSTVPFLNRGSAGLLNEIQGQIKSSVNLDISFSIGNDWLLQLGVGQVTDQLSPRDKTNSYGLNLEYDLQFGGGSLLRINAGYQGGHTPATQDKSSSANFGLGMDF